MSNCYYFNQHQVIITLSVILTLGIQMWAHGQSEKDSSSVILELVKPDSTIVISEENCPCFSKSLLDSILTFSSVAMWWSDVPGCKLTPYHEMYEFVVRRAGLPDYDFNFSAQAGFVDGQPFAGSDLFNHKTGLFEFRCGGTTTRAISESCTKILSTFIKQLRQSKPKADYCGQQGTIPSGFVITRPPPFWMRWEFIVPITILVFGIGFAFAIVIRRGQLERKNYMLKEQAHIIERQRDLEVERNRIATEMHDELGSGLTSIHYWSEKGLRESKIEETNRLYQQIKERSQQIMDSMREIIWAMNTRFDHTQYLTAYLHHFASKFAAEHDLNLKFEELGKSLPEGAFISGEIRRNLFFVFKEILCNIVKHSGCTSIIVTIEVTQHYCILISEMNGIGFDPEICLSKGNGIYNINQRIKAIQGDVKYATTSHGTDIAISVPLN